MSSVANSIVTSILEPLKGAVRSSDALLFAGRLLAWMALANHPGLPPELNIAKYKAGDPRVLRGIWERISQEESLGDVRWAFDVADSMDVEWLSQADLSAALDKAALLLMVDRPHRQAVARRLYSEATERVGYGESPGLSLPTPIADFTVQLLAAQPGAKILISGSATDALATAALAADLRTTVVSAVPPVWAAICATISGDAFNYYRVDPYSLSLSATPIGTDWEAGLMVPPFGARLEASRASTRAASSTEQLAIEQALALVNGPFVVVVSNGFLTNTGRGDRQLHEQLAHEGRLRAVIQFPGGLLKGSGIAFALLVFWPKGQGTTVNGSVFCRVTDDQFNMPRGKRRYATREFIGAASLQQRLAEPDGINTIWVEYGNIARKDFSFSPSVYLEQGDDFLKGKISVPLGDLVDIIKPQHLPDPKDGEAAVEVGEVGPGDIEEFQMTVFRLGEHGIRDVPAQIFEKRQEQVLREGDVLLSVKGSIGKVVAVASQEGEAWPIVPSLSFAILRPNKTTPGLDSKFLTLYLRSPVVRKQIESLASGMTIPNVSLHALRAMPVWVPSQEEQRRWADAFDRQQGHEDAIAIAQQHFTVVTRDLWKETGLAKPAHRKATLGKD